MLRLRPWRASWMCGLTLAAAIVTGNAVPAQQPANKDPEPALENVAEDNTDAQPVYWIGVQCFDSTNDPKLQGLLVGQIVPGSPAAKVGIQTGDMLLSVDDQPLMEVKDLSAAVNLAKDKEVRLQIRRAGKTQTIAVTPTRRPAPNEMTIMPEPDRDALRQWMDNLRAGHGQAPPIALRFFHPGIVVPAEPQLPDDMTVTITRHGKQPAKITVEQGEERWEVTEDKLAELPAQVRAAVEPLVARRGSPLAQNWTWSQPGNVAPGSTAAPADPNFEQRLERRLEDLNRRMEEFHKRMDKWEQQLDAPAKPQRSRL